MRFAVIVPTYQAGSNWSAWWDALNSQTVYPDEIIIIDSSSTDNTVDIAVGQKNTKVLFIKKENFNHGGTRNLAVAATNSAEIIVFLTQDAILHESTSLEQLIKCFNDETIAAVCGRQLPHLDANPLAIHARQFNYSSVSRIKQREDIRDLGIKVAFMSNSFAAYRRDIYDALGRFPEHTILAEDMFLAAKMVLSGYKVGYCAEATVRHSHNYSTREEFQRYFDTGVFHDCNKWIQEDFGGAAGEGARFVKSELNFLLHNHPLWFPRSILATGAKYVGYKLGLNWRKLPLTLCKKLSMYKSYWNRVGYKNENK